VGDPFFEELGRGITKLSEQHYAIKPSTLEHALANLRLLSRAARVAPEVREGKPSGYKLVWVQTDGPIAKLGLRCDDVLVSVNGLDITTPDHVLDAYGKLKAARLLVLGLVREGRRSTLEYAIR
jgi:type II secretory pathway component PulC